MTRNEVYQAGVDRGRSVASWVDLPEMGTVVRPFELPDFNGEIETVDNAAEVFHSQAYEAELNDRQFSPFEFTAADLNAVDGTADFEVWEVFEEGISDGIHAEWESRKAFYAEEAAG
jgi:hypothetical protein